jgi:glycerophosphoryl diester phosphodiesterase
VCFGGFSDVTLAAVRAAQSTACTSAATEEIRRALYKSYVWWPPGRVPYQAFQVPEVANGGTRVVSPRFVRLARRGGRVLHVWTVNAPDDIARLKAWGVDGVITDRPDMALEHR